MVCGHQAELEPLLVGQTLGRKRLVELNGSSVNLQPHQEEEKDT